MKAVFIILMTVLLSLSSFAKDRIEYSPSANSNFELRSNGTGSVLINGNYIENGVSYLKTNQYLDEPYIRSVVGSNTNLYGWDCYGAGWQTKYGSTNLTSVGTFNPITDYLGNSSNCNFDGVSNYLYSSSANLNFNSDFSMTSWVYNPNWASIVGNPEIISHGQATSGFVNYLSSTGQSFASNGGNIAYTKMDTSTLAGWHHFVWVYSPTNSYSASYIDGLLLSKTSVVTSFPIIGLFQIGAYNGAANYYYGGIASVWIQNGRVWTPEQVKQLYARGSRRRAPLNPDNTVDINLPLEGKWFSYTPVWYKSDGTTAFTPSNVNIARYMVRGDTVWYNENLYHTSSSGAAQLGNSTANLTSVYPIKPIVFDNTGIEALILGASFTEYAEGNTSVMCEVALGSKLNHTFLTAFGASGTRAFTNATSGITTCSTSVYYRWQ